MNNGPHQTTRLAWMPLVAPIAPFLAWIIEQWLPYPHIIEELLKLLILLPIFRFLPKRIAIVYVVTLGLLFALTETAVYVMSMTQTGEFWPLILRILLTIPMHICTFLAIYTGLTQRAWYTGFTLAVVIHWGFNWLVNQFLT